MVALIAVERIGASIHMLAASVSSFGNTPGYYSFVAIMKSIIAAGTTLAALFIFDLHAMSLFVGYAAGGLVAFVGSVAMLSRFFKARIDWSTIKDALYLGGWSTLAFLTVQARVSAERALLTPIYRATGSRSLCPCPAVPVASHAGLAANSERGGPSLAGRDEMEGPAIYSHRPHLERHVFGHYGFRRCVGAIRAHDYWNADAR